MTVIKTRVYPVIEHDSDLAVYHVEDHDGHEIEKRSGDRRNNRGCKVSDVK